MKTEILYGRNIAIARLARGMTRKRLASLLWFNAPNANGVFDPVWVRHLEKKDFKLFIEKQPHGGAFSQLETALNFPFRFFTTNRMWTRRDYREARTNPQWLLSLCEICWVPFYRPDLLARCAGPPLLQTIIEEYGGVLVDTVVTTGKTACDVRVCAACSVSFQAKAFCPRCSGKAVELLTTHLKTLAQRDPEQFRATFNALALWQALQEKRNDSPSQH